MYCYGNDDNASTTSNYPNFYPHSTSEPITVPVEREHGSKIKFNDITR